MIHHQKKYKTPLNLSNQEDSTVLENKNYHQRDVIIKAQYVIPFKNEKTNTEMTSLEGLPVYLDMARVICLSKSIEKHLKARKGGEGRVRFFMSAKTL